jgi:adenylate kinase
VYIAITGTPGTGKSSVATVLHSRGYHVVELDAEAEKLGLIETDAAGDRLVDVDALAQTLRVSAKIAFFTGYYAHRMPVNTTIVLRCEPRALRQRLETRAWPAEKVRENVEAEAIDVILQESVQEGPPVFEIDMTRLTPAEGADAVLGILQGRTKGHEPGSVDWTEEVLSWY